MHLFVSSAFAQQHQMWEDEFKITFRGTSLALGTSEQDFDQKYPGGFKSSVATDLREPGSLPTVYGNGTWKLLDPKLTTKEQFLPKNGSTQDIGVFYFQGAKLVALEISRFDPDQNGDLTSEIFKTLRSLAAEGRPCSIAGFNATDREGNNQSQMVRVICGRHYLTMSREIFVANDKPMLSYGLFEGLVDGTAKLVALSQSQN